ncbi:hypothetical protein BDZ97DRAFT_1778400 [Flammula alnicola]|nr:hypothetical protein BDZ97DRAFT_1778400 [Flammula alnicola]
MPPNVKGLAAIESPFLSIRPPWLTVIISKVVSQAGEQTNLSLLVSRDRPGSSRRLTWGGSEYYRAHAATADPYLFDHAWNRVREYGGAPAGGMGVGLHEARHWHRRAYGPQATPEELGHAAAYEAYRTWIYNKSIYEPLHGDIERQREALTALAVAEATRLLQFSSRPNDNYARLAATEAAAHTANYIFYQSREEDHRSRPRFRSGSMDDPYADDDELLYPYAPHARSHSRHGRSHSRHRAYSQSGVMPFPGQAYSSASMGAMPQTAFPGQSFGGYAGSTGAMSMPLGSPYNPNGVPMSAGSAYGTPMTMGVSPSAYNTSMPPGIASSYNGSTLGVPMGYPRSRSSSFSYPQQTPYMGTAMSMPVGMPMQQPGQTIVIHKPRKHKHSKRSHSSNPDYDDRHSHHSSRY